METERPSSEMREMILADGRETEIEVRPITLLCHRGDVLIDAPQRMEISPQITVQQADLLTDAHISLMLEAGAEPAFKMIFPSESICFPKSAVELSRQGMGVKHIMGMLSLLMLCIGAGIPPFLRLPESYLHPSAQAGLADALRALLMPEGTAHERMQHWARLHRYARAVLSAAGIPHKPSPAPSAE